MKVYILEKSSNQNKKFTAIRVMPAKAGARNDKPTLKHISFGAKGYYT